MKAARHILNLLLKSDRKYCNDCGKEYDKENFPCCDNPQVGRHLDHVKGIIKQNAELRKERANDFASNKEKTLRWGISLPPYLFREWEEVFQRTQGEKLFRTDKNYKKDFKQFIKEFKQFAICKIY